MCKRTPWSRHRQLLLQAIIKVDRMRWCRIPLDESQGQDNLAKPILGTEAICACQLASFAVRRHRKN